MKNDFEYMKIYVRIREEIVRGAYGFGDRLPSKRVLAEETGTSVITVEHAYGILCEEGYAEARERSGYFVIYNESDCFPVAEAFKEEVLPKKEHDFGDDFPFSVLAKTARKVLSQQGEELLVKSPNFGVLKLREAIAKHLARSRDMLVSPSNIVIGAGAEYLYSLIVQMLGRDRVYGIENPSYDKIKKVYEANGAVCDMLCMGRDGIRTDELSKTTATALHITPFNSYPSGITASASKRREYLNWAKTRDAIIIEDDFDSEFSRSSKTEDTVFSQENERVIYVNTFSKTIAPSIRMGYMVLPDSLMEKFEENAGFYSCTVSVLEQYIVAEFINNGDFERHINRIRRKRRKNRK